MGTTAIRIGRGALVAVTAATALVTAAACAKADQVPLAHAAAVSRAPEYYVMLVASQAGTLQAVVHASATGAVTGKVAVPSSDNTSDAYVTASADGRTFVVGADVNGPGRGFDYRMYRFTLRPDGAPTALAALPAAIRLGGPVMSGAAVRGIALSPDGTKVAVSVERFGLSVDVDIASAQLDVVTVASGAVRTWTSPGTGYWAGQPSWASGTTVAFPWWRVTFPVAPRITQQVIAVDEVNTAAPGDTLGGKPTAIPVAGGVRSAVLTPDGRYAILAACQSAPGGTAITARVTEVSASAGSLVRVLRTQTASYPAGDRLTVLDENCEILSADPSGQYVLVNALQPARIDNGTVTSLPAIPPGQTLQGAAW